MIVHRSCSSLIVVMGAIRRIVTPSGIEGRMNENYLRRFFFLFCNYTNTTRLIYNLIEVFDLDLRLVKIIR